MANLGKMVEMHWLGIHRKPPDIRVGYSRVEANGKEGMGGGRGVTGGGGGGYREGGWTRSEG